RGASGNLGGRGECVAHGGRERSDILGSTADLVPDADVDIFPGIVDGVGKLRIFARRVGEDEAHSEEVELRVAAHPLFENEVALALQGLVLMDGPQGHLDAAFETRDAEVLWVQTPRLR